MSEIAKRHLRNEMRRNSVPKLQDCAVNHSRKSNEVSALHTSATKHLAERILWCPVPFGVFPSLFVHLFSFSPCDSQYRIRLYHHIHKPQQTQKKISARKIPSERGRSVHGINMHRDFLLFLFVKSESVAATTSHARKVCYKQIQLAKWRRSASERERERERIKSHIHMFCENDAIFSHSVFTSFKIS